MEKSEILRVGLAAWVIQDGNYGDFGVNSTCAFALEFFEEEAFEKMRPADYGAPLCRHSRDARYSVVGRSTHVKQEWWVLDFGVPAYTTARLHRTPAVEGWVRGKIHLSVDSFTYFESFSRDTDAPPLIHDWRIHRIDMQTAPFIEIQPGVKARDDSRHGWREIAGTDAWNDDDGHAEYVLHCERLSEKPRHRR